MKHYRVKDGFIIGHASPDEDGSISFPEGFIDDEIIRENAYIVDEGGTVNLSDEYLSRRNLSNTDWKVIRHRDQLALGIDTSLSDEEYQTLLTNRQTWRNTE